MTDQETEALAKRLAKSASPDREYWPTEVLRNVWLAVAREAAKWAAEELAWSAKIDSARFNHVYDRIAELRGETK